MSDDEFIEKLPSSDEEEDKVYEDEKQQLSDSEILRDTLRKSIQSIIEEDIVDNKRLRTPK